MTVTEQRYLVALSKGVHGCADIRCQRLLAVEASSMAGARPQPMPRHRLPATFSPAIPDCQPRHSETP